MSLSCTRTIRTSLLSLRIQATSEVAHLHTVIGSPWRSWRRLNVVVPIGSKPFGRVTHVFAQSSVYQTRVVPISTWVCVGAAAPPRLWAIAATVE